jgi:hypothetical protein
MGAAAEHAARQLTRRTERIPDAGKWWITEMGRMGRLRVESEQI